MNTELSRREEAPEQRLEKIRRWRMMYVSANSDAYADLSRAFSEIDFLLSLFDSQATTKPTGWISCGLRQGRDDRIVDIVFENAECAKAFIDGIEPTVGPVVAATRMRERCVEKVRDLAAEKGIRNFGRMTLTVHEVADALMSLTLDGEK